MIIDIRITVPDTVYIFILVSLQSRDIFLRAFIEDIFDFDLTEKFRLFKNKNKTALVITC